MISQVSLQNLLCFFDSKYVIQLLYLFPTIIAKIMIIIMMMIIIAIHLELNTMFRNL